MNKTVFLTAFGTVFMCLCGVVILLLVGCDPDIQAKAPSAKPIIVEIKKPKYTEVDIPRNAAKYRNDLIREIRYHWGLDQEPAIFFAQVHQESAWRSDVSSAYATGLTQFTPDTAAWIQGLYPADLTEFCASSSGCPLDARWAMRAMILYDLRLYGAFPDAIGDHRYALMLSSYNGGYGWVLKERTASAKKGHDREIWFGVVEHTCLRAKWACEENRAYPKRILYRWRPIYKQWLMI